MNPRFVLQMLSTSAGILLFAQATLGVELTPYLRATPQGQPKSDIGVDFAADALDLRGIITTNRIGATTQVMPQLVSSLAVASDLKFETRATFANWNENAGSTGDAIETKLTARSVLPMLAEIEGLVRRDAAGESRRKLGLKMNDATVPSFLSQPIVLKANATIEQVATGNSPSTLLTGIEAALVQKSASNSADNRIGFKYTTTTGATEYQRQAAAFSRSWAQNNVLRLGVEYELMHEAANLQSTFRFTWRGFF